MTDRPASTEDLVSTLTNTPEGSSVRVERRLAATIDEVWSAITEADRISRWLAPTTLADETTAPDSVDFAVDFGEGGIVEGEILECDPPQRLRVSWCLSADVESEVAVALHSGDDNTILVLEHKRLPVPMGLGYAAGWHAHTESLLAHVEARPLPDWDSVFESVFGRYADAFGGL